MLAICFLMYLLGCKGSALTNFQLERLRIKPEKHAPFYGLVLNETVSYLQKHYIYRSMFHSSQWAQLRDEAAQKHPNNKYDSIRYILGKIRDPYCRFVEPSIMNGNSQNLRGLAVGLGIRLRRRWQWRRFPNLMRHALFPPAVSPMKRLVFGASVVMPVALSAMAALGRSRYRSTPFILAPLLAGTLLLRTIPFLRPFEVVEILNDSAEQAGVRVGDTLLLVNERSVPCLGSQEHIVNILNRGPVGEIVNVTVLREETVVAPSAGSTMRRPQRSSSRLLQLSIQRDYVLHETLEARLLSASAQQGTGYIRIREFSDETFSEFTYAWEKLQMEYERLQEQQQAIAVPPTSHNSNTDEEPTTLVASSASDSIAPPFLKRWFRRPMALPPARLGGLIIDLRGNPGGALVPALDIAAMFLPGGATVTCLASNLPSPSTAAGDNDRQTSSAVAMERFHSTNAHPDRDTALLLLTDESTASASEILVEALCDNHRALSASSAVSSGYDSVEDDGTPKNQPKSSYPGVAASVSTVPLGIPTKTVGKNLAQAVLSLSDGSGLYFSVREFFTPSGKSMRTGHRPRLSLRSLTPSPHKSGIKLPWGLWLSPDDAIVDQMRFDKSRQSWCTGSSGSSVVNP